MIQKLVIAVVGLVVLAFALVEVAASAYVAGPLTSFRRFESNQPKP